MRGIIHRYHRTYFFAVILSASVFSLGCQEEEKLKSINAVSTPFATRNIPKILEDLLKFHPGWISRSSTSHDPHGGNGDGSGLGHPAIKTPEGTYQVLFHGRGEGRILRHWMTVPLDTIQKDWQELWIEIDGKTIFRGNPLDYFEGRG